MYRASRITQEILCTLPIKCSSEQVVADVSEAHPAAFIADSGVELVDNIVVLQCTVRIAISSDSIGTPEGFTAVIVFGKTFGRYNLPQGMRWPTVMTLCKRISRFTDTYDKTNTAVLKVAYVCATIAPTVTR